MKSVGETFSDKELKVLRLTQRHFGFSITPYAEIAQKLDLSEKEVIETLEGLTTRGVITRIGPFFNLDKSNGHVSLVAMEVSEEKFEEVSRFVNSFDEVAHNYKRNHRLNMWFVLATKDSVRAFDVLNAIEKKTGLKTINLPKIKEFGLDLYLEV